MGKTYNYIEFHCEGEGMEYRVEDTFQENIGDNSPRGAHCDFAQAP